MKEVTYWKSRYPCCSAPTETDTQKPLLCSQKEQRYSELNFSEQWTRRFFSTFMVNYTTWNEAQFEKSLFIHYIETRSDSTITIRDGPLVGDINMKESEQGLISAIPCMYVRIWPELSTTKTLTLSHFFIKLNCAPIYFTVLMFIYFPCSITNLHPVK